MLENYAKVTNLSYSLQTTIIQKYIFSLFYNIEFETMQYLETVFERYSQIGSSLREIYLIYALR